MDALAIFGAKYLIYLIMLVFAIFLYQRWSRKMLILTAVSLPVAYVCARVAGMFYSHIQPFALHNTTPLIAHAVDNAFPSDHTLIAAVLATIILLYNRNLGLLLWVAVLGVGAARVYAGLHYPIDVVASALIALVVVSGVRTLLRRRS